MGTEELRGTGPAIRTSMVFNLCCERTRLVGKDLAHIWRSDSEILCTDFTDLSVLFACDRRQLRLPGRGFALFNKQAQLPAL